MWTGAALVAAAALLATAAQAAVVAPALRARLDRDGDAPVVVLLQVPGRAGAEGAGLRAIRAEVADAQRAVLATLSPAELEVSHIYRALPGLAGRVSATGLQRLADHPAVLRIDVDATGRAAAGDNIAQIRADRVRARGISGNGVTVAVIDAGLDASHPDLAEAVTAEACFCSPGRVGNRQREACCAGGMAASIGPGAAASTETHGMHVAGIALSRGRLAPPGVAPSAALVGVRVLDDRNEGLFSDWIAALDWILTARPEVRVVNMSLVSDDVYRGACNRATAPLQLLAAAVDRLRARGAIVVAAAGNNGRADALTAPACLEDTIAVGAVDGRDAVAGFSNGGSGLDLWAPGVSIVSSSADGVAILSGTSMAAPHVAGAAALLMQARPSLGATEVERVLRDSGRPVHDPRSGRISPRVDAFAALRAGLRGAELERGGGSGRTDCLLEWSVIPPAIVARHIWPTARCRDGDPLCDADREPGRCTFLLAPCFNMQDPALPQCVPAEPLEHFTITSPPIDAPSGSIERTNVDVLAASLPAFPFAGSSTCTAPVPFVVVRRSAAGLGRAHIRMAVATDTRRDYDHLVLECLP